MKTLKVKQFRSDTSATQMGDYFGMTDVIKAILKSYAVRTLFILLYFDFTEVNANLT